MISLARSVVYFVAGLTAGTRINGLMLASVMRAPLSFYHTNPTGRILNRFSKDQGSVDEQLPLASFDALQVTLSPLQCSAAPEYNASIEV